MLSHGAILLWDSTLSVWYKKLYLTNVSANTIMDTIFGSEHGSDSSTDGGEDDVILSQVGVFKEVPCPWIRFAWKISARRWFSRSSPVCARIMGTWYCYSAQTVETIFERMGSPVELFGREEPRNDVRIFAITLAGAFLHRCHPDATYPRFVPSE